MMKLRLLALFLAPAAVLAQSDPEIPANLFFETDMVLVVPKWTMQYGVRGLTGAGARFLTQIILQRDLPTTPATPSAQESDRINEEELNRSVREVIRALYSESDRLPGGAGALLRGPLDALEPEAIAQAGSVTSAARRRGSAAVARNASWNAVNAGSTRSESGGGTWACAHGTRSMAFLSPSAPP